MEFESEALYIPYLSSSKPIKSVDSRPNEFTIGPLIPDYLTVDNKDPIRQWKVTHENEMFNKLIASQKMRREIQHSNKLEIVKLLRKVPVDLITKEFLNKEKLTIDSRAYIIDKIIPVVVLGLEKLLIEADKRGLIDKDFDANFNPINFLAQYLMRNNPAFANFNEASPYVRGLRQVVEELKVEIFHLSDNKLARVKASAKSKRTEREKDEQRKKQEAKRRIEIYQQLFDQFVIGTQTKVDYETVHLSIKSFSEIVNRFPEEMRTRLAPIIQMVYTETKDQMLGRKDFALLISHYADDMPLDIFDHFTDHLSKCAKLYRSSMEKEVRRKLLSNLFMTCDLEEMGLLDRQRILLLFDQFFDKAPENIKAMLRDPKYWPISDYNTKSQPDNRVKISYDANSDSRNGNDNTNNDADGNIGNNANYNASRNVDDNTVDETGNTDNNFNNDSSGNVNENITANIDDNIASEIIEHGYDNTKGEAGNTDDHITSHEAIDIQDSVNIAVGRIENDISSEKAILNEEENVDVHSTSPTGNEQQQDIEIVTEKDAIHIIDEDSPQTIEGSGKRKSVVDSLNLPDERVDSETVDIIVDHETMSSTIEPQRRATIIEDRNETLKDVENSDTHSASDVEDIEEDDDESHPLDNKLERETTKVSTKTQSTAYDEENINFPQFFQVTEEFLGETPTLDVLEDLIEFIREGYQETPEERLKRLQKARRQVLSAQRKKLINELFNTWDENNAGSVNMNEISETLKKYKNGILAHGIKAAKKEARISQRRRIKDLRLNAKDFGTFMNTIVRETELMAKEDETETMITYFIGLVQRTYAEKLRAEARRKWLNSIVWAGEVSCGSIDGVYRAVFQALYKDAEQHGDGKKISSCIALLEDNKFNPDVRGKYLLHFMVSTPDLSDYVVGQIVDKTKPNIYFKAIYSGNAINLTHSSEGSNVKYWNPDITDAAKEGSLAVIPIKDEIDRVFGIITVDTLNDPNPASATFLGHEILFYQGLTQEFSTAFHQVEMLRRFVKVSESAISWICRRIGSIKGVDLYLREKHNHKYSEEFVLRYVLSANDKGKISQKQVCPRLEKNENLFKTYLFDAVETSQTVLRDAYGERHIAIPLRDLVGVAITVIDINIGELKFLPNVENNEITRMMSLLQQAFNEIIKISQPTDSKTHEVNTTDDGQVAESGSRLVAVSGVPNVETIFHELMLVDLRANVAKLDYQAYAELRSYKDPPVTIHAIIQALLGMLYPKEANSGLFKNWEKCKIYISINLGKLILAFDPFGNISDIPIHLITESMLKIPSSEIDKHSSKPALDLYNWVFCCFTLIEHRLKVEDNVGHIML